MLFCCLLSDWLDGIIARHHHRASEKGWFIDVITDRISEGIIFSIFFWPWFYLFILNILLNFISYFIKKNLTMPLRFAFFIYIIILYTYNYFQYIMEIIILFIIKVAWYFLPIGIANMMPVIFRKWFNFLAIPLDGNKSFIGQPLFGSNKTLRGLLVAIMGGALTYIWQENAYNNSEFFRSISIIDYSILPIWVGSFMGLGAITGDLVKSFFKRRAHIPSGKSWFPRDQIDFTLGGMIFSFIFFIPSVPVFLGVILLGAILHIAVNTIGKTLGIRKSAW